MDVIDREMVRDDIGRVNGSSPSLPALPLTNPETAMGV